MKAKSIIKHITRAVVMLIYSAILIVLCFSWPTVGGQIGAPLFGELKVGLSSGDYPLDSTELTLVAQSGDFDKLDRFKQLESLDLRGSTCYDEILTWGAAHPNVKIRYSVSLPSGLSVENDAEAIDLTGLDSASLEKALELFRLLPALKSVELGDDSKTPISVSDFISLCKSKPDIEFSYLFDIRGQQVSIDVESVDLIGVTHEEVEELSALLSCMPKLKNINLGAQGDGNTLSWEDISLFQSSCPTADVLYKFSLWGKDFTTLDESMDFNHITMNDRGAAVREVLPCMTKCSFLDMDFCDVSNADMAAIRDDFPNIKVVWRIWIGEMYSVRTDVVKILASKVSVAGQLTNEEVDVIRYCSDLKYLDIGHNDSISDISFLSEVPTLEVLVIAMNPLSDISVLAQCPELEYIELNSTNVSDLSALSGLTKLRHLNLGNCPNVKDISPLYGLTELERLWLGSIDPVPAEQVAVMQEAAPECRIDTTTVDPTQGGWRYADLNDKGWLTWEKYGYFDFDLHPRYELLREQFGYERLEYSFYYNDPLY